MVLNISGHLTGNTHLLSNDSYMEHLPNTNDKVRENPKFFWWHCQIKPLFHSKRLTSLKSQNLKLEKLSKKGQTLKFLTKDFEWFTNTSFFFLSTIGFFLSIDSNSLHCWFHLQFITKKIDIRQKLFDLFFNQYFAVIQDHIVTFSRKKSFFLLTVINNK